MGLIAQRMTLNLLLGGLMSSLVEASIVIVAGFICLFLLILIPVLIKVGRAATEVAKLAEMIKYHIPHISNELAVILSKAKEISGQVNRQMHSVEDIIHRIRAYEMLLDEKVVQPVLNFAGIISGFMRGFTTFWRRKKDR
jgi:hypothetical protein